MIGETRNNCDADTFCENFVESFRDSRGFGGEFVQLSCCAEMHTTCPGSGCSEEVELCSCTVTEYLTQVQNLCRVRKQQRCHPARTPLQAQGCASSYQLRAQRLGKISTGLINQTFSLAPWKTGRTSPTWRHFSSILSTQPAPSPSCIDYEHPVP